VTEPDAFPTDRGLGSIDYSQAPKAVYYIASTGDRWRVHDCVVKDGKPVRIGLPDTEGATCRVFVAATGVKRYYRRLKGEVWRATPAQLDRQLAASEFLATGPSYDISDRTAR
jgi:hypothetical protein